LATITSLIPPQTLFLDAEIAASAIFHASARLEQGFVSDSLRLSNPQFGSVDRQRFNDHLEDIRRSASKHEAMIRQVGQSAEFAGSLELLRLAMKSMVISARTAGFTSPGDKRQLRDYAASIGAAATTILEGMGDPKLGLFNEHKIATKEKIEASVNGLIANSESTNVNYRTLGKVPKEFFLNLDEKRVDRVLIVDERFKPGGPDLGTEIYGHVYPSLPPGVGVTGDGDVLVNATFEKTKFSGRLATDQHFLLAVNPHSDVSDFTKLVDGHNEAKALDYIYIAAEYGLKSVVARTNETILAIDDL
jgi:hypothetical protein